MAIDVKYELVGHQRVQNALRRLASDYRKEIDDTIAAFAKEQRALMKGYGYPPQRRAPQPFKSERSRRWFFWALRSGIISVPYKRTGRLANSWSAQKNGWGAWTVQNSATYASLVVGRGRQAAYHAGHWWEAESVIEKRTGELTKQLTKDLIDLTRGME